MHFIPPRNTVPGTVGVLAILRVQRELRKEGELWVYIRLLWGGCGLFGGAKNRQGLLYLG